MGSLNVCSGESSTRTLFLRVMDTFDDDDDDDCKTTILYKSNSQQYFGILLYLYFVYIFYILRDAYLTLLLDYTFVTYTKLL